MRRSAVFAAILAGSLLVGPAARADTGPSYTRIDSAERRAQGGRVLVHLAYSCPAGATVKVAVTVTAVNGTRIAQGSRAKRVGCTGAWTTTDLRVERNPAGATFLVGEATAETVRTVCDDTACRTTPFDETIRIG